MLDVKPIVLYHGAQRWEGPPRVVPHKKGHAEAGAGIYMTTSYETARKYAKGGGSVIRFELDRDIRWLEDARLDYHVVQSFIASHLPRRHRQTVGSGILGVYSRSSDGKTIPADALLNLMVNYEAIAGTPGVALAAFYVDHGIDASHDSRGSEDWVILFNPAKIRSWRVTKAADVSVSDYDLPRIERSNPSLVDSWWARR